MKAATGWDPIRLVVEEDGGPIVAAVSLLERKVPVINKKIFTLPGGRFWIIPTGNCSIFAGRNKEGCQTRGAFVLKLDPDLPSSNTAVDAYLKKRDFLHRPIRTLKAFSHGMYSVWIFPLELMSFLPICTAKPAIILDLPGAGAYP